MRKGIVSEIIHNIRVFLGSCPENRQELYQYSDRPVLANENTGRDRTLPEQYSWAPGRIVPVPGNCLSQHAAGTTGKSSWIDQITEMQPCQYLTPCSI